MRKPHIHRRHGFWWLTFPGHRGAHLFKGAPDELHRIMFGEAL